VRGKRLMKLFFHTKPVKILLELLTGPKYATIIAKKIDCTYSHTVKLLDVFNDYGIVSFEKKGRIKIIKLTPKGEELATALHKLVSLLESIRRK